MTRSFFLFGCAAGAAASLTRAALAAEPDASLVRSSDWQSPQQQEQSFSLPPGFRIELFASEPMINKPINLAFDAKGRLWVSSNTEYPFPASKDRWADPQGTRVQDSRDAIKILEDTDGDGRADKSTDFADGLNIPIGVLPYKDGCIAWSIPNIWYLADTDGDGKCDQRTILFGPLGYEKDTHGNIASLRLAPDGWVYATHGFNNVSRFEVRAENRKGPTPDPAVPRKPTPSYQTANQPRESLDWGNSLELQSGNVFRFKPDGSAVEIWSWGQVNPFGLAWDAYGDLYSADCHSNPLTQVIRGAAYPSFGRPDLGLGFGPVLCEHSHGSTGICGPLFLDGGVWGADWDNHMFVCNPVTSRINHDIIRFTGATPRAVEQPDFLTSTDLWFRPVDMRLGPDGALFIADFYNKIIGHYEVELKHPGRDRTSGRIWRVVKDGVTNDTRRPMDEQQAAASLRFNGLPALVDVQSLSPRLRRRVAENWFSGPAKDVPVSTALDLWRATAPDDPTLRHALELAIRHGLTAPGRFALLPDGKPEASELLALVRTVPGAEAASWQLRQLKHAVKGGEVSDLGASVASLARQLPLAEVPELMGLARRAFSHNMEGQAAMAHAVAQGLAERGESPDAKLQDWMLSIASYLVRFDESHPSPSWESGPNTLRQGLPPSAEPWGLQKRACADGVEMTVLSSLPQPGGEWEKRTGIVRSSPFPLPASLSFWICGHRGAPDQPAGDGNFVRLVDEASGTELARVAPPRSDVAQRVLWEPATLAVPTPEGQNVRLEIVDGETGDAYAWLAVGRIEPPVADVGTWGVRAARMAAIANLAPVVQHSAPRELREKLAVFLPPPPPPPPSVITPEQRAELDSLIQKRIAAFESSKPDPERGRAAFATHCAVCHAIDGQGALVGPQLEGIGTRGVARLIEDIVDPNRNIDSNFYVHLITRKDGTVVAGLERGSAGEVLLCVDATGKDHRIPKSEIEKNELTGLSLMPAAFGQSIPEADFNDLIAFLFSHGGAPPP